ncbi:MAG TPA: Gfo/Idh/MocA family oxidoreductase [Candidatus Acidoferrales bacterium]|nr:Gfo/Idh/MocA family oxidoreductase [Candidatus Acidoferrales bacterium]
MGVGKKVGFAVVGLGTIAQGFVLPSFAKCKNAKLVAVVSRDQHKATRVARKFKAEAHYSNEEYAACLANPAIDAVFVATPNGLHESFTVRAAQAGKHVLCEKPLAATAEQAARMVEACRRNRVLLMTAYRKYFEPSTLYLKQLIQNGDLGRIDVIHTAFSELYSPGKSLPWLVDSHLAGGGPLMDLGVYCVNTTRWLVEEDPVEVSAQSWARDTVTFRDVEEAISFRLQFPSGLVVQGSSSYGAVLSSFIYVQGTKGWASLTPAFPFDQVRRLTAKIGKRAMDRKFAIVDEFGMEISEFAAAIQSRRPVESDGVQGHRDMVILESIYNSARKQRPLVINY